MNSPHPLPSDDDQTMNSGIPFGGMLLTFALYGLSREFGWQSSLDWVDGGLLSIAVLLLLNGGIRGALVQGALLGGLFIAVIAQRHGVFELNMGVIFFGLLLIVGASLVLGGFRR